LKIYTILRYEVKIILHLGECPSGNAWADKAYQIDKAHQLSECSNAGTCDRTTGQCRCFPGFAGPACQRSTFAYSFMIMISLLHFLKNYINCIGICPNHCNGHGVCMSIRDISVYKGPEYDTTYLIPGAGNGLGMDYYNWERYSVMMCNCDNGFFGPDCSLRK